MAKQQDIIVKIQADIADLNSKFKNVQKDMGKASKNVASFNKQVGKTNQTFTKMRNAVGKLGITIGVAFAVRAIARFAKSTVDAYNKQIQLETKLRAVLKSTGHAAGISAKQMFTMAKEMQRLTMFGDEELVNAQALMATFTSIGKDVFPEAIKIVADMSTVLGKDLQSSVIQVGKALNDPILGVSALAEAGVNFNEQQRETIKGLVRAGKQYEAQTLILNELKIEFGGVAEAMAKTDVGKMKQLENAWGDLKETIGSSFTMALGAASQEIMKLVGSVEELMKPKLSEKLEDEKNEVNALTLALMDSSAPMEAREKYYERLKVLAPDIIEGIQLENLNTRQLSIALAEYNALMVKKIVLAKVYERAEEKANEAGEEFNENLVTRKTLLKLTDGMVRQLADSDGKYAQQQEWLKQQLAEGNITFIDYVTQVRDALDATGEFTNATAGQLDEIDLLNGKIRDYITTGSEFERKTKDATAAMNDYQQAAEELGLDIDNISTAEDDLIKKYQEAQEEMEKLRMQTEKDKKAAKKAWEEHVKAVEEYDKALEDLNKTLAETEASQLGGVDKIRANMELAIAEVDQAQEELLKKGQEAHGKAFKLEQEQLDQFEQLRQAARDDATIQAQEYYQGLRDDAEQHYQEQWQLLEDNFSTEQQHNQRLFELRQQMDKSKFLSVKRSAEEIRDFEAEQQKKLINFQVQQLRELQSFYEQNADKGLFGPLIEQTEAQINALLSELERVTNNPEIQKKTKSIQEKIFNDLFGFDLTDAQVQQAAEIIGKAYDTLTASIASGIDQNIAKIEEHISAIDEDIAAAENAVEQQRRLQEEGSASNVRIEQQRLNELNDQRNQYLKEREAQVEKEKNLEKTMAAIKGAIAIANVWAAESSKGTAGIILAVIETAAILAAIGAAFSDSSSAVSGWFRDGTAQVLGGQSHEGGGVSLGPFGEAEKGEFLGILSAKNTKKYGKAMMSLFDGLNSANGNKTMDGLIGLAGTDILSTGGATEIALKEQKELKGMYNIMKQQKTETTHEENRRIEKTGGHTRIIYN